jgi:hypothetical protein
MATLTASALLQVWEQGQRATHPERALLLLDATGMGTSPGNLPVGRRDGLLLALRERLFGRAMVSVAPCPHCGEQLELPLDTRQFQVPVDSREEFLLEQEGYRIRFRVPVGADLVACAAEPNVMAAHRRLLGNCILGTSQLDHPIGLEDLPERLINALAATLSAADPGADLQVEAFCPACNHHWQSTFDIVSFLWTEVQDWAFRILREVHALASVYGWSERDILDLSPWRRHLYLQMVGQ